MGLLDVLLVETEDSSTSIEIDADSKEEALDRGQELHPTARLALVSPHPGETSN